MHLSYMLDIGIHVGGGGCLWFGFSLLKRETRLVLSYLRLSGLVEGFAGGDNLESLKEKDM